MNKSLVLVIIGCCIFLPLTFIPSVSECQQEEIFAVGAVSKIGGKTFAASIIGIEAKVPKVFTMNIMGIEVRLKEDDIPLGHNLGVIHDSKKLMSLLYDLRFALRARDEKLIKWLLVAYQKAYDAALSEEKAHVDGLMADYTMEKADAVKDGSKAAFTGAGAGALAGAAIGSCVPIIGTAVGGIFGALIGFFGGVSTERHVPLPKLPTEAEMIKRASLSAGLGESLEDGLHTLEVEMRMDLLEVDVVNSETMLGAYEILLKQVIVDAEYGLLLADVVTRTFEESSKTFGMACEVWEENSAKYQYAQAMYKRTAKNYDRAAKALLLSIVISGIIQTYTAYTGMSTAQYRGELVKKGVNVHGKEIDHIIPQSRGGIDHPWNYQTVPTALNRAWSDSHLFEKCLNNPIGFAKAVTVNYPGIPAAIGGITYYNVNKRLTQDSYVGGNYQVNDEDLTEFPCPTCKTVKDAKMPTNPHKRENGNYEDWDWIFNRKGYNNEEWKKIQESE